MSGSSECVARGCSVTIATANVNTLGLSSQDVEAIKKQGAEMNTTVENSLEELKSEMNTTMGNNLGELKSEMNRQSNRAIDEERKAVKEQGTAIRAEVIGAMKINFGELWASMKKNFGTILEYAEQISRC